MQLWMHLCQLHLACNIKAARCPLLLSASIQPTSLQRTPSQLLLPEPKMAFTTHNIVVAYRGKKTTVHYWADGHGRRVEGFVTSLSQLRVVLQKKFGQRALDLYCIDGRHLRSISSDRHLTTVLEHVRNGGTLLVQAYEHRDIDITKSRHQRHGTPQATR